MPPPSFPLVSIHTLWCFTVDSPPQLIDLDDPIAYRTFLHRPHQLLNPAQFYATTETLADLVRVHGTPRPHGIKAPSVRVPRSPSYQPYQCVFCVFKQKLAGRIAWKCDLVLEFVDSDGHPVIPATREVDWSRPRFQLGALPAPMPPFGARSGARPIEAGLWYRIDVRFG